jgi:hypothetical protein
MAAFSIGKGKWGLFLAICCHESFVAQNFFLDEIGLNLSVGVNKCAKFKIILNELNIEMKFKRLTNLWIRG